MGPHFPKLHNRLLLALSHELRERLMAHCRLVEFPAGHSIYSADAPTDAVYFVNHGLVSMIKRMEDGKSVEVGAAGIEGLIGLFAVLGFDRALVDYVVQVPVAALCINKESFRHEMYSHSDLRRLVEQYLFFVVDQIAQSAACNRLHTLERRCCRWLLTAHDNAFADHFSFTHEFLASLLGVQRPSLSVTAHGLQKRGLIDYKHGHVTIVDRAGLELNSCSCYQATRRRIEALYS
jgi:CRP-like cAMP-binding protein